MAIRAGEHGASVWGFDPCSANAAASNMRQHRRLRVVIAYAWYAHQARLAASGFAKAAHLNATHASPTTTHSLASDRTGRGCAAHQAA
jgi:hypothetical protein